MRRLAKRGRAPGRVCGKPRTSLHFRWGPPCEPGRRDTGGGRKSTIGDGHIAVWRLRSSAGSGRRRFSTSPARATPENMGARPANADCTRLGTPAGTVTGQSRRDENHKPLTERHFLTVFGSHPKALQGTHHRRGRPARIPHVRSLSACEPQHRRGMHPTDHALKDTDVNSVGPCLGA